MWPIITMLLLVSATSACAQWQTQKYIPLDPNGYEPGVHYLVSSSDNEVLAVKDEIKNQSTQQDIPSWVGKDDKLFFIISKPTIGTIKVEVIYWGRLKSPTEKCPCVGGFYAIMKHGTPESIRLIMGRIKSLPRDNEKQIVVPTKRSA